MTVHGERTTGSEADPLVFVSHSSVDIAPARALRAVLAEAGIASWMAPDDIRGSRPWPEQILAAIDASTVVTVLVSAAANGSGHVARELTRAVESGSALVPIRLEDVKPSGSLGYMVSLVQWVDVFPGGIEAHRDAVLASIGSVPQLPTETGEGPDRQGSSSGAGDSTSDETSPKPKFPDRRRSRDRESPEEAGPRPGRRVLLGALATTLIVAGGTYATTLADDNGRQADGPGPGATEVSTPRSTASATTASMPTSAGPKLPQAAAPVPEDEIVATVLTAEGRHAFVRVKVSGEVTHIALSDEEDSHPSLSPDRRSISYRRVDATTEVPSIRIMGADGSGDVDLFTAPDTPCTYGRRPAWNTYGSRVAVPCLTAEGDALGLYVLKPDGTAIRRLSDVNTETPLGGASPTWSSGGLIVYQESVDEDEDVPVDSDTTRGLWRIDPAGGLPTQLPTQPGSQDTHPAWSLKAEKLLFLRTTGGRSDVYVAGSDGSSPLKLTDVGDARSPAWAPDGETVAFISAGEILLVDAAGGSTPRTLPADLDGTPRHLAWDAR